MTKWLAKHNISKFSFKITISQRHVYIDICWPWICNRCFYLGIWNDDRPKWMFCLRFISLHDLIHKTQMKLRLFMNS